MSGNNSGPGRLPSLMGGAGAPGKQGLKFKPKVVARRSEKEREASAPKLSSVNDHKGKPHFNKKNATMQNAPKRRTARYLENTHVISSGPLAAGNFMSGTSFADRPVIKTEIDTEVNKAAVQLETKPDEESKNGGLQSKILKFDMGKEFDPLDDEAMLDEQKRNNFPMRPTRIKHEDLESAVAAKTIKMEASESILQKQLHNLDLHSVDNQELMSEIYQMNNDHAKIWHKLQNLQGQPNKFMAFQLPSKLPQFKDQINDAEPQEMEDTRNVLNGNIGSIRLHKSGRLTMKVGNTIMDLNRGADTTFLQSVVAIDNSPDSSTAELLGHIDDKVVATPRF